METLEYIILGVIFVGFGWLFFKNRGNNTGPRNLPGSGGDDDDDIGTGDKIVK